MIISRRQRESLLDEVSRMLANKQNVAFANHAKIADRVSNGDLALYMDSAKKEFVMKYGNNNIRFNPKDKSITDLSSILFSDKSTLQGITSTPSSNDKIAISAKWAYTHYQDTLKRMKKWNPEGLNILQGEATITGITEQRQGAISSTELVGNVERSVVQSSHITEPLFWVHNQCKRHALNMLLNTAKGAWQDTGKNKLQYVFDNGERAFLNIPQDFYYQDMDVFVSDTSKDLENINKLQQLIQPAM